MAGVSVYEVAIRGRTEWRADIPDPREGGRVKQRLVFYRSGVPRSKQTRAKAERLAQCLLDRWDDEAAPMLSLQLSEFLELAKTDPGRPRRRDRLSVLTVERRNTQLDHFGAWMASEYGQDLVLADVKPLMIDRYLEHYRQHGAPQAERAAREKPCSETGVQRVAAILKRAWNYGIERKLTGANPVVHRSRQKPLEEWRDGVRRKAFTDDELLRIWDAFENGYVQTHEVNRLCHGEEVEYELRIRIHPEPWLRLAIEIALHTGLRGSGVRSLLWENVDLDRKVIQYDGKNGLQRTLIDRACHEVLSAVPESERYGPVVKNTRGDAVSASCLQQAMGRLMRGLGLQRSFHSCRHWKGLQLAARNVPLHRIMQILGLSQLETVRWYLRDDIEEYAEEYWDA